jgi:O-antigen ligase
MAQGANSFTYPIRLRSGINKRLQRETEDAGSQPWIRLDVHTCALVLSLFLFATNAAFLTPTALAHTTGSASMVAAVEGEGLLHTFELAIALGLTIPMILARWRQVSNAALQMSLFSASALLACASSLWSQDPLLSLRSGMYLALNTLFAFYLVRRLVTEQLMRLILLLGVVVSLVSIAVAVGLPQYGWSTAGSHPVLQGAFIAKNALGNAAVILLTPIFFVRGVSKPLRAGYAITLLVLILLSFSLQAWLAAVFCFLFVAASILYRRLRGKDRVLLALVTLVPLAASLALILTNWSEIALWFGKDPTLTGRTAIWAAVVQSIAKRPLLGWGYDAFWQGFKGESASVILAAHWGVAQSQSGVLEVLLGLGAIGLALVVATWIQGVRNAFRCIRNGSSNTGLWYLLILCLTALYSIGEALLQVQNSMVWILYIVACAGLAQEGRSLRKGTQERFVLRAATHPKAIQPLRQTE